MKGGHIPIHIQRWSAADYHADEHVKLLVARHDYLTLTFYRHFLDFAFVAGGDLPADVEALAAVVLMPPKDVERALSFCLGRLISEEGGRLYQARVKRDVSEELQFRSEQFARGKLGGRPRKKPVGSDDENPSVLTTKSPPAPAPFASADAYRLSPAPQANPHVDRNALVKEGHALIPEIATLEDLDQTEVLSKASAWNGRSYVRLDTMPDDRLAHTLNTLRRWQRRLRGAKEPTPPSQIEERAPPSDRARARQQSAEAMIRGGMTGDHGPVVGGRDGGPDRVLLEPGPDAGDGEPTRPALPPGPRSPDR